MWRSVLIAQPFNTRFQTYTYLQPKPVYYEYAPAQNNEIHNQP